MGDTDLEKITEEINLLKKLNHPNIINYISGWFDENKNEIVIITEIFTGGSLRKHLNKLKYPRLKLIKYWIKEILKGLIYLHNRNPPIIHRDIKCENIFINSQDGTIKIGDLGFSCLMMESYAKSFLGTPEFMAPEVYKGKYGLKADIYSLGMCVLEIVTLEKPYKECENIYEIFENVNTIK
jgi:WNK lysine deficient protein kinase